MQWRWVGKGRNHKLGIGEGERLMEKVILGLSLSGRGLPHREGQKSIIAERGLSTKIGKIMFKSTNFGVF